MVLTDNDIGNWDKVEADEAIIWHLHKKLGFGVRKINGTTLYRGLERLTSRISWTGFTYSLNPETNYFSYKIGLFSKPYPRSPNVLI